MTNMNIEMNDISEIEIFPSTVKARLVKSISYRKNGHLVTFGVGTHLVVDLVASVGLIAGDHVDVSADEYQVLYMN